MPNPLGITLPIKLGSNGYFNSTVDVAEQVKSNLTNLLLTQKGERPFLPDFGCDLPLILFENISNDAIAEIDAAIQTAIKMWMPFISIGNLSVTTDEFSEYTYVVSISYTILNFNITDSITLVL